MALTATYSTVDQFTVTGDYTANFYANRKVRCACGVDGTKYRVVSSSSEAGGTTTVNLVANAARNLTPNLTEVDWGVAGVGSTGNMPLHGHSDEDTGGAVFNEAGADADFRIEGANENNLFYTDAGNDRVGIGTATPAAALDVLETTEQLRLSYDGSNYASLTVASDGALTLQTTGTDEDIEIRTGTFDNAIFIDDSASTVGIGVADPDELLELYKVGTQLKLSGGAADYATFAVAADGALTITTVDTDAAEGDIILAPDGNVGIAGATAPTAGLDVGSGSPGHSPAADGIYVVGISEFDGNVFVDATLDVDGIIVGGSAAMTSVSTGAGDNDKMVTQGYVDDNAGGIGVLEAQVFS